jgi:hypothetical protein
MPDIEEKFNEFVNGLSAAEQEEVMPLMATFIAANIGPTTAQASYSRAAEKKDDDMEEYHMLRRYGLRHGP